MSQNSHIFRQIFRIYRLFLIPSKINVDNFVTIFTSHFLLQPIKMLQFDILKLISTHRFCGLIGEICENNKAPIKYCAPAVFETCAMPRFPKRYPAPSAHGKLSMEVATTRGILPEILGRGVWPVPNILSLFRTKITIFFLFMT